MGDNLPAVDLGTGRRAVEISAGELHTCARLDDGQVKCWGSNNSGQLGLGDEIDRGIQPGEMGDSLPAIDLGTGRSALEIVAGRTSTCTRLDNGESKCWGSNGYGGLGLGDTNYRGDGPGEMGDNLPAIDFGAKSPIPLSHCLERAARPFGHVTVSNLRRFISVAAPSARRQSAGRLRGQALLPITPTFIDCHHIPPSNRR